MKPRRQPIAYAAACVIAFVLCLSPIRAAETLPAQLTDQEFWSLVSDFSEPNGSFLSDNYVSNERSYQQNFLEIAEGRQPASAYVGVGPEQNFTYILALKPQIAFVVDIRRQNMIEHLMYKALFELSADRAEFLSRLFSRQRPESAGQSPSIDALFDALGKQMPDMRLYQDNLQAIEDRLTKDHGFRLSSDDEASLQKIFRAFRDGGPNLTYNGPNNPAGIMPTFGEVMIQTGTDGINRGFLSSEDSFRIIRELQKKNLLIPLVGDFAGPLALRSVGEYLRIHNATVTSFYTSNVEQYLFQSDAWRGFYANVTTLPVNSKSVFIRGVIRSATGEFSPSPALPRTSHYETELFSIADLVDAYKGGSIQSYVDIVSSRK